MEVFCLLRWEDISRQGRGLQTEKVGEHDRYKVGGLGTGKVGGHDKSRGRGIRDWKCGMTLGSSKVQ